MAQALGKGVGVEMTYKGQGHGAYDSKQRLCAATPSTAICWRGTVPKAGHGLLLTPPRRAPGARCRWPRLLWPDCLSEGEARPCSVSYGPRPWPPQQCSWRGWPPAAAPPDRRRERRQGRLVERLPARSPDPSSTLPASLTTQKLDWSGCKAPGGRQRAGLRWQCSTLKVPLDYAKPDGETIEIALIRARAPAARVTASAPCSSTSAAPAAPASPPCRAFADDVHQARASGTTW